MWFFEKRGEGGGGRKRRTMRNKEKREADISKVGALGEHLIIIYIRSVSPSPQNGQIQQREQERESHSHIKEGIDTLINHTNTHKQFIFFIGRHAHTPNTHGHRLIMGLSPDCVECGSTPSVYFEGL